MSPHRSGLVLLLLLCTLVCQHASASDPAESAIYTGKKPSRLPSNRHGRFQPAVAPGASCCCQLLWWLRGGRLCLSPSSHTLTHPHSLSLAGMPVVSGVVEPADIAFTTSTSTDADVPAANPIEPATVLPTGAEVDPDAASAARLASNPQGTVLPAVTVAASTCATQADIRPLRNM